MRRYVNWRLEFQLSLESVCSIPCLLVTAHLRNVNSKPRKGYMFYWLTADYVSIESKRRVVPSKWHGLPRGRWYYIECPKANPQASAHPSLGIIPLQGSSVDRGPKHVYPALPNSTTHLGRGELERVISLACNLKVTSPLIHRPKQTSAVARCLYIFSVCYHGGTETAIANRHEPNYDEVRAFLENHTWSRRAIELMKTVS